MFKLASSSHSSSAAASKALACGMPSRAIIASTAPTRKYGRRRPSRPSQVRSDKCPMIGWTKSPVSGAAAHSQDRSSRLEPSDWNTRLMFAFCSAKPIWMPKNPKLILASPAQLWRGFSMFLSLPVPAVRGCTRSGGRQQAYEYVLAARETLSSPRTGVSRTKAYSPAPSAARTASGWGWGDPESPPAAFQPAVRPPD